MKRQVLLRCYSSYEYIWVCMMRFRMESSDLQTWIISKILHTGIQVPGGANKNTIEFHPRGEILRSKVNFKWFSRNCNVYKEIRKRLKINVRKCLYKVLNEQIRKQTSSKRQNNFNIALIWGVCVNLGSILKIKVQCKNLATWTNVRKARDDLEKR